MQNKTTQKSYISSQGRNDSKQPPGGSLLLQRCRRFDGLVCSLFWRVELFCLTWVLFLRFFLMCVCIGVLLACMPVHNVCAVSAEVR